MGGIGTVLLILFANGLARNMDSPPKKEEPQEKEYPQAVQFVDPDTPEQKMEGVDINKLTF